MSDILIKGMKIPASCAECGVRTEANCFVDYKWLLEHPAFYEERRGECPLIEIPPHGRLIDADALDTSVLQEGFAYALTRRKLRYTPGEVREKIQYAPTIIPADVPDNNVGNIPAEEGE